MVTVTTLHPIVRGQLVVHDLAHTPPVVRTVALAASVGHVVHHGTNLVYAIAAVPLAIAVIVALIVWRSARRERARRALSLRLANSDPRERRKVLDSIDDDVLARNSAVLFDLLGREHDPDVLDALAAAVARSRWEPTDDRHLIELRRWVAGSHTRTTASTTTATVTSTELATAPAADQREPVEVTVAVATAPSPVPVAGSESPEMEHALDEAAHDDDWTSDPLSDDEPGDVATPAPAPEAAPREQHDGTVDELADFVPRVRALIGSGVERVELSLITGTVLKTWSSTEPVSPERSGEEPSSTE